MANGDFSVQQLVADVRRRAMIPNSTQVLTDADITGFLNDEMWEYIVPMLMATTEEYLVAEKDLGVPASTVIDLEDQNVFTGGVIGLKIRDVQVQSGNAWISLPRIEPEREGQQFFASNATQGYMFRGSKIHLVPVNQTPGAAIRVLYYKRPTALVSGSTTQTPGIPQDLCPLLIQRAVYRCLDALGDSRAEAAAASAERTRVTCIQLISPRGEGSARVIINYNGPGWTYRRRPYSTR
jgi:hypothetical protein